jgi:hypothetical protein
MILRTDANAGGHMKKSASEGERGAIILALVLALIGSMEAFLPRADAQGGEL